MNSRAPDRSVPPEIAEAFGIDVASLERMPGGHINLTFKARLADGSRCVLQRVNPIFPPVVNRDIDAVTSHLTNKGHPSPALLRTRTGTGWIETGTGVWRAMTFIEGASAESLRNDDEARAAGELLGRFHSALDDLSHEFESVRSDPHDTPRHLAALERALTEHVNHRNYAAVAAVAAEILDAARSVAALPGEPLRVVHGDPKISNLLFDPASGEGLCLVDLDTLGRRSIAVELGDAFRSWCNPAGEDDAGAHFSVTLFRAAIAGYAAGSGSLLTLQERRAVPAAIHTIGIELAARFCADALNEKFFGWDVTRFADASAHNVARARAQLHVGLGALAAREAMLEIIDTQFSAARP